MRKLSPKRKKKEELSYQKFNYEYFTPWFTKTLDWLIELGGTNALRFWTIESFVPLKGIKIRLMILILKI